jgi:hypothetical protein
MAPQFMRLATSLSLGRWGLKPERWPSASMEMTRLVQRKHHAVSLNVFLECDLGPRTKADRDFRIVRARSVPVENSVETKVSATSAGRVATACKL